MANYLVASSVAGAATRGKEKKGKKFYLGSADNEMGRGGGSDYRRWNKDGGRGRWFRDRRTKITYFAGSARGHRQKYMNNPVCDVPALPGRLPAANLQRAARITSVVILRSPSSSPSSSFSFVTGIAIRLKYAENTRETRLRSLRRLIRICRPFPPLPSLPTSFRPRELKGHLDDHLDDPQPNNVDGRSCRFAASLLA